MTYPEQVKSILWNEIYKMAQVPWQFALNPNVDFTRDRKLDFGNLLRFLITKQNDTTANELLKYFDYDIGTISNSAFYQQRQKLHPDALPFLLYKFNSNFDFILYRGIYNLVACDGCDFNIFRNPDDPDTFHSTNGKSERGFNSLLAVALYDLLSKRYLDCVVQPGRKKNEFKAICELVDRYPYDGIPIFIADRGFSSYNFFAHAMENGRLFMVRAKDLNVKRLLKLETLPDKLDVRTDIILSRTQAKGKLKRTDLFEQYRFISPEVTFDFIEHGSSDDYPMSLRIVRFETADGVFINIITNLPTSEFGNEEIKYLYNLRWGIETSFRDLKHTIGTTNFISKKLIYIEQEIWARLILFNFCSIITLHIVVEQKNTKHTYQVNFTMAMKICHDFIRKRGYEPPPDVERLIGRHTLPIRLGRNFKRQHRFQTPFNFCYR